MIPDESTKILIAKFCGYYDIRWFEGRNAWYGRKRGWKGGHSRLPDYDDNLNAWKDVHRALGERGLWPEYSNALFNEINGVEKYYSETTEDGSCESYLQFRFATATAEQRCAAMVAVIKGEKKS